MTFQKLPSLHGVWAVRLKHLGQQIGKLLVDLLRPVHRWVNTVKLTGSAHPDTLEAVPH
jgi:hypothetical protein